MPGNPRYQPQELVDYFGYDKLYSYLAKVEMATMDTLFEIGVIPNDDYKFLNARKRKQLLAITTTEVDGIERKVTKHDVRAWVRRAQEILDPAIGRWVHIPLTSCDGIETAATLRLLGAYNQVTAPTMRKLILRFADRVEEYAMTLQIGRTHGQHALPITVGFWLATILSRLVTNYEMMEMHSKMLCGKISGAVGAYNAQVGLGFAKRCGDMSFEERVLDKLGLEPARISTQILPPESFVYFLYSCSMASASLGQFGVDCRHLMRSEIAEISEPFAADQVGSSTMAHKRNPINFENLEGTWRKSKIAQGYLAEMMISEHQRDLVNSSLVRDLPLFQIYLQHQMETLLRKNEDGTPFINRIAISPSACMENFKKSARVILAEPLYIAMQMAGFRGDAHEFVNHKVVPILQQNPKMRLMDAINRIDAQTPGVDYNEMTRVFWGGPAHAIPEETMKMLNQPHKYTGFAKQKALEIAAMAREKAA